MTKCARTFAARPAGVAPGVINAPSAQRALLPAGSVPVSGGVPPIVGGGEYFVPDGVATILMFPAFAVFGVIGVLLAVLFREHDDLGEASA